jgi:hypothetical protein
LILWSTQSCQIGTVSLPPSVTVCSLTLDEGCVLLCTNLPLAARENRWCPRRRLPQLSPARPLQFKVKDELSLRAAAFPLSLLFFQHLIYPLDGKLTLAGLGYDYGINEAIARRPWLELGIPEYKKYCKRFLVRGDRFMDECNVNP